MGLLLAMHLELGNYDWSSTGKYHFASEVKLPPLALILISSLFGSFCTVIELISDK
jgi:hypothetical protein